VLVTANVVSSLLILSTMMMEVIPSSEESVLTRASRRHIPEDGILLSPSLLQSHARFREISYISFLGISEDTDSGVPLNVATHVPATTHSHISQNRIIYVYSRKRERYQIIKTNKLRGP
jgi:hypothetical protein